MLEYLCIIALTDLLVVWCLSDLNPAPTDEVCHNFNELRQDIVLLYELKSALVNCDYELQTLRHQFTTLAPGQVKLLCNHSYTLTIPIDVYFQPLPDVGPLTSLEESSTSSAVGGVVVKEEVASPLKKKLSENIDVASTPQPSPNPTPTTQRKRKAALEQGNMLRKLKQKM